MKIHAFEEYVHPLVIFVLHDIICFAPRIKTTEFQL